MPIYEYRCEKCGELFEIVASFSGREAKAVCPGCGGRDVSRRFGSVSLGGSRTSINPGNFVRPNRPGAKPRYSKT
jgi:putative FmdB family regulatory protein